MNDAILPDMHRSRHALLHACLDELVADYIAVNGDAAKFPSEMRVSELLEWSHEQTLDKSVIEPMSLEHPINPVAQAVALGASSEFAEAMVKAGYRARQCHAKELSCDLCALGADCDNIRVQLGVPANGCGSYTLYWIKMEGE